MSGDKIINQNSQYQLVQKSSYLKLQNILLKRLPISFQLYNAVHLLITSRDANEDTAFEFYTRHGIIDEESIIVALDFMKTKRTDQGIPFLMLSVHSAEVITSEIAKEFVSSFSIFDTDDLSIAVERNASPFLAQAFLNKGYILSVIPVDMVYMTNETTLESDHTNTNDKNEIPESNSNYIVKSLEPEDAKIITDGWNFGNWDQPVYYAERCIAKHPSCGVYSKETGELMSWAICYNFGSIGMLFTREKFRGQGLGKVVMKNMIRKFKEKGLHPGTGFEPRNTVSGNLMNKIGFQQTHALDCIFTK